MEGRYNRNPARDEALTQVGQHVNQIYRELQQAGVSPADTPTLQA